MIMFRSLSTTFEVIWFFEASEAVSKIWLEPQIKPLNVVKLVLIPDTHGSYGGHLTQSQPYLYWTYLLYVRYHVNSRFRQFKLWHGGLISKILIQFLLMPPQKNVSHFESEPKMNNILTTFITVMSMSQIQSVG